MRPPLPPEPPPRPSKSNRQRVILSCTGIGVGLAVVGLTRIAVDHALPFQSREWIAPPQAAPPVQPQPDWRPLLGSTSPPPTPQPSGDAVALVSVGTPPPSTQPLASNPSKGPVAIAAAPAAPGRAVVQPVLTVTFSPQPTLAPLPTAETAEVLVIPSPTGRPLPSLSPAAPPVVGNVDEPPATPTPTPHPTPKPTTPPTPTPPVIPLPTQTSNVGNAYGQLCPPHNPQAQGLLRKCVEDANGGVGRS